MDQRKMAWRTLDDRQMGRALANAYRMTVGLARSQVNGQNQSEWQHSCQTLIERTDALCDVADERSIGDRLAKRKEFADAKGLDFHGSKDLKYLEQRLMEIASSWPDKGLQHMVQKCTKWRDGENYQQGFLSERPFADTSIFPSNCYGKDFIENALPYPNESNTKNMYGLTEKEENQANLEAIKRSSQLVVE